MSTRPALAPDAAMVLGIAATAIPFARTPEEEAERWLRVLRLHGEVGNALQSLGVSEDVISIYPANGHADPAAGAGPAVGTLGQSGVSGKHPRDVIALVGDRAAQIA